MGFIQSSTWLLVIEPPIYSHSGKINITHTADGYYCRYCQGRINLSYTRWKNLKLAGVIWERRIWVNSTKDGAYQANGAEDKQKVFFCSSEGPFRRVLYVLLSVCVASIKNEIEQCASPRAENETEHFRAKHQNLSPVQCSTQGQVIFCGYVKYSETKIMSNMNFSAFLLNVLVLWRQR